MLREDDIGHKARFQSVPGGELWESLRSYPPQWRVHLQVSARHPGSGLRVHSSWDRASWAVVVFSSPERLAEVTANGPAAFSSARATGWSGMRTPRVGCGERISGIFGWRGTTRVSAPGQCFSAKAIAAWLGFVGHIIQLIDIAQQYGDWLPSLTHLDLEQFLDSWLQKSGGSQPVNRIGGEDDRASGSEDFQCCGDRVGADLRDEFCGKSSGLNHQ